LIRETRGNVSLQVSDTETGGAFEINARGEMQIAILVEQMRREGYEVMVSRPEVIFHRDRSGNLLEPLEDLYVDLPERKSRRHFAVCCRIAKAKSSACLITRRGFLLRRSFLPAG
jgi:predicted membrane GTPase involved in stress response